MTATSMAIAIFTPSSSILHSPSSSSSSRKIPPLCSFSSSAISIPKNAIFHHIKCVPHLGLTPFSQWDGLKSMGLSISRCSVKMERKRKCRGKGVYASLFGVGAPEVLVIGVVALLVFGPKGLAEVARNLGKTLRAFQPTIRELQEVSREFKSTLEREIGLDDIDTPVPRKPSSNTTETDTEPNGSSAETSEDPVDASLKMRADQFKGALAQLQKEQEEERKQKEEEKLQAEAEAQATVADTSDAPETSEAPVTSEAPDTVEESSSVTLENLDNVLQETAAGAPAASAVNNETQS